MRSLFWWRPPCLLRRVIVNTTDPDVAFQGVLWESRGPWLTLKDAYLLAPEKPMVRMDGDLVLHREKVTFLQVMP